MKSIVSQLYSPSKDFTSHTNYSRNPIGSSEKNYMKRPHHKRNNSSYYRKNKPIRNKSQKSWYCRYGPLKQPKYYTKTL